MLKKAISWFLCAAFITGFTLLGSSVPVKAATIHYFAQGDWDTLQECIDDAAVLDYDTIVLPAETFDISTTLEVDKKLTIRGQGSEQTILRDGGTGCYVKIFSDDVTIDGIQFLGVSGGDQAIKIYDYQDFVIKNCKFLNPGDCGVETWGSNTRGVIYNCNFINGLNGSGVRVYGDLSSGDDTPNWVNYPRFEVDYGSENWVFVENSRFEGWSHAIASNRGSKYVFRYNKCYNCDSQYIDAHGLEWTSSRGSRAYEIYGNECYSTAYRWTGGIWIRGGDGLVYDNYIENRSHPIYICNTTEFDMSEITYPAVDQILEMYVWGNTTNNGVPVDVDIMSGHEHLFMHEDPPGSGNYWTDYKEYEKPNYTPYPYPHPLTGETPAPTATPTPIPTSTPTPSATPTPTPILNNFSDDFNDGNADRKSVV